MKGSAFVFINNLQAARFGHVGWGFSLDEAQTRFYFGSTDHLYRHPWWDLPAWVAYAHLKPETNNDWWSGTGTRDEMFRIMHQGHHERYHIRYHLAKEIEVSDANGDLAVEIAERLECEGWSVLANNCIHQTFNVLTAYGASLPEPARPIVNLIPKRWFAAINGTLITFQ